MAASSPGDLETLMVASNPDGAEIYVDQNFVGNAPATLKLLSGSHTIRLSLAGYHSWTSQVSAQSGAQARLTPTLVKAVPGAVRGRVLWNEQPVAGTQIYARECTVGQRTRYGPAVTDAQGHFSLTGVPDGRMCLDARPADSKAFWGASVTMFEVAAGEETIAPDTYVCKLFAPISPRQEETVKQLQPILKWDPYPDAVSYSVQVWRMSQDRRYVGMFRRGDRGDTRLRDTNVQVDVDLSPGEYFWRVDAVNAAEHVIGCNYPIKFTVVDPSTVAEKR